MLIDDLADLTERFGDRLAVHHVLSRDPEARLSGRVTPDLVERLVPLTHYLPPSAAVAVLSPERVASRAVNLLETNREFLTAAWHAATTTIPLSTSRATEAVTPIRRPIAITRITPARPVAL